MFSHYKKYHVQECKNNYRCVVDKKNRTACKACRLRKCLMVGMSKSGSRYGRRSNWFKIHCLMQQNLNKGPKTANHPPLPQVSLASSGLASPPHHHHGPLIERSLPPSISWPPPPPHSAPLQLSPLKPEPLKLVAGSRSPSPLNISLSTDASSKSSHSPITVDTLSPRKYGDLSPHSDQSTSSSLPIIPTPTSLPALYGFPPPLPFLSNPFPFYRLSPLLAGNPFLANSLLFSMSSQKSAADLLKEQQSHADLLKEHRSLLDSHGEKREMATGISPFPRVVDEEVKEQKPLLDLFPRTEKEAEHKKSSIFEPNLNKSLLDIYPREESFKDPQRALLEAYARGEYKEHQRALLEAYVLREQASKASEEETEEKVETPIDLTVRGGSEEKKLFE